MVSVRPGGDPLKGTCSISVPVARIRFSIIKCEVEPTPQVA
jgi:hypothetical protein